MLQSVRSVPKFRSPAMRGAQERPHKPGGGRPALSRKAMTTSGRRRNERWSLTTRHEQARQADAVSARPPANKEHRHDPGFIPERICARAPDELVQGEKGASCGISLKAPPYVHKSSLCG